MKKIFIIGFNKIGTRSLHIYFSANGIKSVHWDKAKLASTIDFNYKNNKNILEGYENYTAFSDMEDSARNIYAYLTYYKEFDKQYPESKFILNIRYIEDWIKSRNLHGKGNYIRDACKLLGLSKEKVNDKWRKDYKNHIINVKEYFSDKPNKLLIFDIDKDEISKINKFFPEYNLDGKLYKHIGRTRKK